MKVKPAAFAAGFPLDAKRGGRWGMSIVLEDNSLIEKRNDRLEQAFREKIFPYFIEHEYRRFYSLAGKDQYAGAWYELKDLSEVVIKLPILLGLSYLFFRYSDKKEEDIRGITEAILSRMITKTLSLGDWSNILETLSKNKFIEQKIPALSEVIKNAKDFCDNCNIVEWRNNMIGHGALPFEDSEEFKAYICNITQGIDTCLENSQEYYANIEIIGNDVLEVVISGDRFQVDKCIFRQIFFFDSFNKQTYNIDIIDYLNGKRDKEKNRWYYEFMRKHALEEEIQRYRGADSQKRMWEWQDIMGKPGKTG
ncbi:hypothetical protein [Faecalicatena fissicatena]|uniref:Apea-like HEPN domain-containing protein n=1 Tax=Faecalicatena fissicatena TaxID=290055 RepID=A0ABS2E6C7_9FIRM|nr:hypothetical protein [Faecalicatena fissicatena]MBM6737183.1 hypothetical protein [Faecalicatena fissicatena]